MIRNSSWGGGDIPYKRQRSPKPFSGSGFSKLKTPDAARVTGRAPENQTSYPGGQTARHPIRGAPGGNSLCEGGCFLSFALRPLRFSVLNSIKHVERSSFSINRTWPRDGNFYRPPPRVKPSSSRNFACSTSCGAIVEKIRVGEGGEGGSLHLQMLEDQLEKSC